MVPNHSKNHVLLVARFIAILTLLLDIWSLNFLRYFLDISATEDGFLRLFNDACIVSLSRSRSSSSPFFQSSNLHSNADKWPFDWEFLGGFCSKRSAINIIASKQISFIGKYWSHSCINLVVSSMHFLLAEPVDKRKRFFRQKTFLSYILFIVSNKMAVPECDHGYIVTCCLVIPSLYFLMYYFWLFLIHCL